MENIEKKLFKNIIEPAKEASIEGIEKSINNFFAIIVNTPSYHYRDVIAYKIVFQDFRYLIKMGVLAESEILEIKHCFVQYIFKVHSCFILEQKSKKKESYENITLTLDSLLNAIAQSDRQKLKTGFTSFFAENYSYYEADFYRYFFMQDTQFKLNAFVTSQNVSTKGLIKLIDDVNIEKNILHNRLIEKYKLKFSVFRELFELLEGGELDKVYLKLENKTFDIIKYCTEKEIRLFNSKKISIDTTYFWRKIISLNLNFIEFNKTKFEGIFYMTEQLNKKIQLIKDLFAFIEESIIKGDDFLFIEYFNEKENPQLSLTKEELKEIRHLISNSKTEACLNLLILKFRDSESDILNDLIILKAQLKRSSKDKLLGLPFDEKVENKINYSILELIKDYVSD